MASPAQIKARKAFVKKYAGKKKGSKSKSKKSKSKKSDLRISRHLKGKWIIFYDEGNYEDVEFPRVKRMGDREVTKEINTYTKWLRYEKVFARDPDEIKVIDYYLSIS